jgi:hypothetical protein
MADTTEKTIAAELREAASRLRTAGSAASKPPWRRDGMAIATGSGIAALAYNGVDADWIALASPALAEPLASWLEEEAELAEESSEVQEWHYGDHKEALLMHLASRDGCGGVMNGSTDDFPPRPLCGCFRHPLAVARVLNGGQS